MSEITAPTIAQPKGTMINRANAQFPVIMSKTLLKMLENSDTIPAAPSTAKNISNHPLTPKQAEEGLHDTVNDKQAKKQ